MRIRKSKPIANPETEAKAQTIANIFLAGRREEGAKALAEEVKGLMLWQEMAIIQRVGQLIGAL